MKIIKLNKKDIKAIYKAHKYLCDIKSDLLENELGKILFQYEKFLKATSGKRQAWQAPSTGIKWDFNN